MKRLLPFMLAVLFIMGCASSAKLYEKGRYDAAINKSIKKILKKRTRYDEIRVLDRAYKVANDNDNERIKYLLEEGNADNWEEVYQIYSRLKNRQTNVRRVLPLKLPERTINYEQIDYDKKIVEAKGKAADYFWDHGQQLMKNGDKASYRQAYYELNKAKNYTGGKYQGIDQLIEEARYKGISRVLIRVINETHLALTDEFEDQILAFDYDFYDRTWVEYHLRHMDNNITYDYFIDIKLKRIDVSPDKVEEKDYVEKKEVQDGWEYVLDEKGNVKKDSLGNDIKVPKYKTLTCAVVESVQSKSAMVQGEVEFVSLNPRKLIKKVPISAETLFEHFSARAIGDKAALSERSLKLIEREPAPFPHDLDLVFQATETLKLSIRDALRDNSGVIY
ncbi:MAG: hypothetical protein JXB49_02020 [Bacteroidales bacterium]|nr:hypothetical protein [Bacteroidales bacterium]